jgi:hypothetical protein
MQGVGSLDRQDSSAYFSVFPPKKCSWSGRLRHSFSHKELATIGGVRRGVRRIPDVGLGLVRPRRLSCPLPAVCPSHRLCQPENQVRQRFRKSPKPTHLRRQHTARTVLDNAPGVEKRYTPARAVVQVSGTGQPSSLGTTKLAALELPCRARPRAAQTANPWDRHGGCY